MEERRHVDVVTGYARGIGKTDGVREIRVAPNRPARLYIIYLNKVLRSDDRGVTWVDTNFPATTFRADDSSKPEEGQKMAVDPNNADVVYVGTEQDGLYSTFDAGTTWTKVASVPGAFTLAGAIVVDGNSGLTSGRSNVVYVLKTVPGKAGHFFAADLGASQKGVPTNLFFYRSTDGGATRSVVADVTGVTAFGFGKELSSGGYPTVYFAGWYKNIYGIYRSTDDAATFKRIGDYPVGRFDTVVSLEGDMNLYGRVYVGFGGSGFAYGQSLTAIGLPWLADLSCLKSRRLKKRLTPF